MLLSHGPYRFKGKIDISSQREWSKKISPAQSQGGQDALFHGQGRSQFGARSVLTGRERERCGGLEACEPEGPETGENAAGGPFDQAQDMFFQHSP